VKSERGLLSPLIEGDIGGRLSLESSHVRGDFFVLGIQGRLLRGLKGTRRRDVWPDGRLKSPHIGGEMGGRLLCYKGSPTRRAIFLKVKFWATFSTLLFRGDLSGYEYRMLIQPCIVKRGCWFGLWSELWKFLALLQGEFLPVRKNTR
jgi:hypothetical protein